MTQKDKELLLKDLCARLPYNTKFRYEYEDSFGRTAYSTSIITGISFPNYVEHCSFTGTDYLHIEKDAVKPYLFPLSSMTEEQKQEYTYIVNYISPDDTDNWKEGEFIYVEQVTQLLHFYHINHLDYRGLITMGLAIDATGLNIY